MKKEKKILYDTYTHVLYTIATTTTCVCRIDRVLYGGGGGGSGGEKERKEGRRRKTREGEMTVYIYNTIYTTDPSSTVSSSGRAKNGWKRVGGGGGQKAFAADGRNYFGEPSAAPFRR